ncbi:hypothetical protein ACWERV_33155 [Streptomyces sp. NPDC004031]
MRWAGRWYAIQQKRSPWALNNQTFQEYLATGLDVAYLLTGLQG